CGFDRKERSAGILPAVPRAARPRMQRSFGCRAGVAARRRHDSRRVGGATFIASAALLRYCFFGYGLLVVVEREAPAGCEIYFRLPSKKFARFGDVGAALLGIIRRQRFVADLAF